MKMYRDLMQGCLISEKTLKEEFDSLLEEEKNNRTFEEYIKDCTNKNGFLEFACEV